MTLTEVYEYAENGNVEIDNVPLLCHNALIIDNNDGTYNIGINQSILKSSIDEKMAISHEIAHCMTDAFYNAYTPLNTKRMAEARAVRHQIKMLVPKEDLCVALMNGYTEIWELAEYFDVPDCFIIKAVEYYKEVLTYEKG